MEELIPPKYSKDGVVVFTDHNHTYTFINEGLNYKKNEKLISVTTIIHHYVPPFDPDGSITARFALENKLTVEEVKEFWRIDNHLANVYGTLIHSYLEEYIIKGFVKTKYKYRWIIDEFKTIKFDGKLYPEKLLYSSEYKLAGQCDLTEVLPNGVLRIWDFKTNKKLELVSEFGNKMLYDLSYCDDCNFIHYKIQLSIYARLYQMKGAKIESLNLIYFDKNIKKMTVHTFQPMDREVDIILNNRLIEINSPSYVPQIIV